MKSRNKKGILISVTVLITVIIVCIAGYFGYGATMINPDDEQYISDFLSADKDNPITILDFEKYGDYAGVLYTDPVDKNSDIVHFTYMIRHNLYKNRYKIKGGGKGNTYEADSAKASDDGSVFFIYSRATEADKISVFEFNILTGELIKKLDEFEVPETSYVITKSYELEDTLYDDIMVFNGSLSVDDASEYFQ